MSEKKSKYERWGKKAGFCHYHHYTLTFRQMRAHGCLQRQDGWCKRFEPNISHPWWIERLNRRSRVVGKPFRKKMKGDGDET